MLVHRRTRWVLVLACVASVVGMAVTASGAPPSGQKTVDAHPSAVALPLAARSACFGAAARDPRQPCRDARLRSLVFPSPTQARRLPNSPCAPVERGAHMNVCSFGVEPEDASQTIALVGDSHASHWRAALDVVAQAKGWHGISIAHTSCPLSKAVRNLEEPDRFRACIAWKHAVFAWFERHPEIKTVFVGGLSGGASVIPPRGQSSFAASVRGYQRAWNALPPTVERIVVIRDTPKMRRASAVCIDRALAMGRPTRAMCSMPRGAVMDRDPMIAAAARMSSDRVRTVDLTRYFCGPSRCYPVVGGALALRDETHLTAVFSTTLGPYLLRKVDALMADW
jgi:hypothetical protein